MYRVAICEDELIYREALEKDCSHILTRIKIEYRLSIFKGSEEFLDFVARNGMEFDLLLLDIVMEGRNGMELAQMIRKTDEKVTIIFITSNPEFALQGYDVKAMHYLLKPVSKEILGGLIQKDYKTKYEKKYYIFENGAVKQKIWIEHILYLEIKGRKVEIVMKDEKFFYRGKLSMLLQQLPSEQFFRCHQSFAINIKHMKELTQKEVCAVDGKRIPISRKYTREILTAFMKHLSED